VRHSKKIPTSIIVTFNEPLDSNSGANAALYRVLAAVKKHGKTAYTKVMKIKTVSYLAGSQNVTINLAQSSKGSLEVIVQPGLVASNGTSSSAVNSEIVP
jgi:hypothetical protein